MRAGTAEALEAECLSHFQLSDLPASLAREQRFPTVAPGRATTEARRPGRARVRVASPGLSPSGKEPRVEEEEGGSQEDKEDTDSSSESEAGISKDDKNVTTRKNIQKSKE